MIAPKYCFLLIYACDALSHILLLAGNYHSILEDELGTKDLWKAPADL